MKREIDGLDGTRITQNIYALSMEDFRWRATNYGREVDCIPVIYAVFTGKICAEACMPYNLSLA